MDNSYAHSNIIVHNKFIMADQIGKSLIIIGGILVFSGTIFLILIKFIKLKEFPGTLKIESGNLTLIIPILASIILSAILTLFLNLVIRLLNK